MLFLNVVLHFRVTLSESDQTQPIICVSKHTIHIVSNEASSNWPIGFTKSSTEFQCVHRCPATHIVHLTHRECDH